MTVHLVIFWLPTELPKDEFEYSLKLIEMAGKDLQRKSHKEYCSSDSRSDFQSAIADTILENYTDTIL